MINTAKTLVRSCAFLAVVGFAAACSSPNKGSGGVTAIRSALSTTNGLWSNGLTTNGLWSNGLWSNGLWSNGLWSNGLWSNGLWSNGLWSNGLWSNGLWSNGLWSNGLGSNGLWSNGLWSNGLWSNGLPGQAGTPADTLRQSPYARQLLQYIYSCAMPATTYDTSLDPNTDPSGNGSLPCATSDAGADGGAECDIGYACSEGKCVVPLNGAIGLAVNDDGTTWWRQPAPGGATDLSVGKWGKCDLSCQRWVSACVLARTNAFGVHVPISMRAPLSAPTGRELQFAAIQAALAVTSAESPFSHREGAYYGNLFATTPVTSTGDPRLPPPPMPPATTFSGPDPGLVASTPSFYACAGPDSNTPAITRRFCSSQGDQSVINVPGVCVPPANGATATDPAMCAGMDATGSIYGCNTGPHATGTHYDEVITVYLEDPLSACGNSVCEKGEESTTDAGYCPADCHPNTWAKTFDVPLLDDFNDILATPSRKVAAGTDGSIVVADVVCNSPALDLDGDSSPTNHLLAGSNAADLVLVKFDTTGAYLWGLRTHLAMFDPISSCGGGAGSLPAVSLDSVSIANDGSIVLAGHKFTNMNFLWAAKFVPNGPLPTTPPVLATGWPIQLGNRAFIGGLNAAVDSAGNVAIAGLYSGASTTFGSTPPLPGIGGVYALKLWSDGFAHSSGSPVAWAKAPAQGQASGVVFDVDGNVVVAIKRGSYGLFKLASGNGDTLGTVNYGALPSSDPTAGLTPQAITADSDGNVYVTGYTCRSVTVECNVRLAKYGSGPTLPYRWSTGARSTAGPNSESFGLHVAVQGDEVFVAGTVDNADFGAGLFETYQYPGAFVAAYTTADALSPGQTRFQWAKPIPIVLDSIVTGFAVDSQHAVILGGNYSGSMQLDDVLLVNGIPELTSHRNMFVGRFSAPSTDDTAPPVIGAGSDSTGLPIFTVPLDIYAEATQPDGAIVFYMPPTAIDAGGSGASVSCTPAPNTLFKLGPTLVTCIASDPIGNHSPTTCDGALCGKFTVTVVDTVGPVFSSVGDVKVQATDSSGATAPFTTPSANDQVDGPRPVTCVPAASGAFPVGVTPVTCTSGDSHGNTSTVSFTVTVTPAPVTVSCVGSPGAPALVSTPPGMCGISVSSASSIAGGCGGGGLASCTFGGQPAATIGPGDNAVAVVGTGIDGSTTACTSYVRVVDGQVPLISCQGVQTQCTDCGGALATPTASCTDNCSCTSSCVAGFFPVGTSSGSCTATDPSGNGASCQPMITVVDTIPPVVTPRLGPAQLQCAVDAWSEPGASASDRCVGDLSSGVTVTGAVDPLHVGAYAVSYAAADPSGNVGSASRAVSVVDTLAPLLTLNPSLPMLQCGVNAYVEAGAKASDLCAGNLTSRIVEKGTVNPATPGTYTLTYSVADPSGNGASAQRQVSVIDTLAPTTTAVAGPNPASNKYINVNVTSYSIVPKGGGAAVSGSADCWTSPGISVSLGAKDVCGLKELTYGLTGAQKGGATVASGSTSVTVSKVGSTTLSFTATDKAGNVTTTQTLPIFIGLSFGRFGFSCAPSTSFRGIPSCGTVTAKGTLTSTNPANGKKTTLPFSVSWSYCR